MINVSMSRKFLKVSGLGYLVPKKVKGSRKKSRIRTFHTYQNKLNKIKNIYNKLYNYSLKAKEKGIQSNPNYEYFCDRYPTFESFVKNYKLKEPKTEK